ncbi:hypothetical protein DIGNKC_212 [Bacillus phage DIGNKC]|uniref:hypothetical protein n=1 Tax=Bacillus phage DIGNKC TaxID=1805948 RepID=UPI0007A77195|nr:hypothetical protein BI007_gp162 [Bacillus phage DIGNKC]AMW62921.1 hypothetical protein DIGNKC_212 [Bacillus phage DIGNKC]
MQYQHLCSDTLKECTKMFNFKDEIDSLYDKYAGYGDWSKTSVLLELKGILDWCYSDGATYSEFLDEVNILKDKYNSEGHWSKVLVLEELEELV